nr:IS66 family transposase [Limosilactobacillus mucosae]
MPFNRQERIWKAASLELNSKQMANAVIKGADRFLKPLYNLLCDQLRQEKVVHMDETPFKSLTVARADPISGSCEHRRSSQIIK